MNNATALDKALVHQVNILKRDLRNWSEVAELAHAFLESLPHGWLAHTPGDVGLLNDFYIKYRKVKFPTS